MKSLESEILAALVDLDKTVKDAPLGRKAALQPLFARLDELARRLPVASNPELLHYLHRKSYEKARLLLEGRKEEIGRGTCS